MLHKIIKLLHVHGMDKPHNGIKACTLPYLDHPSNQRYRRRYLMQAFLVQPCISAKERTRVVCNNPSWLRSRDHVQEQGFAHMKASTKKYFRERGETSPLVVQNVLHLPLSISPWMMIIIIGNGGLGIVYRAALLEGQRVAIKRLDTSPTYL